MAGYEERHEKEICMVSISHTGGGEAADIEQHSSKATTSQVSLY